MKAVYKVVANSENVIHRGTWNRPVTWGPLEYDSQVREGALFSTRQAAERFAERKNNLIVDLLAERVNNLTGIIQGKGATEFRMCVQALKEKTYTVKAVNLRDH